jgi:hypothetical protein
MPVLLPALLMGSYVVLAANEVPKLNYGPSCKAAAQTGLAGRNQDACKADEETAHTKLQEEWSTFNAEQRRQCLTLSKLGGPPSYVELLTCLEMARDAAKVKTFLNPTEKVEQ